MPCIGCWLQRYTPDAGRDLMMEPQPAGAPHPKTCRAGGEEWCVSNGAHRADAGGACAGALATAPKRVAAAPNPPLRLTLKQRALVQMRSARYEVAHSFTQSTTPSCAKRPRCASAAANGAANKVFGGLFLKPGSSCRVMLARSHIRQHVHGATRTTTLPHHKRKRHLLPAPHTRHVRAA